MHEVMKYPVYFFEGFPQYFLFFLCIIRPGPPEFTEELRMRQETDGVLLESFLIYEPEHQATWFKDDIPLLGALDFDEKYQPFLERRGDWTYCALAIRLHLKDRIQMLSVVFTTSSSVPFQHSTYHDHVAYKR